MSRKLTGEERAIWDEVRRSIKPLDKRPPEKTESPPSAKRNLSAPTVAEPSAPARPRARKAPASIGRLEERTRRGLARGLAEVEARIDLHGMRQERAFSALMGFLRRAQIRGERLVLVITGKGLEGREGRGVLRQVVPEWLARSDLRELVVGFEDAARRSDTRRGRNSSRSAD
jgi:DNA-nicking Smr family endonuclease